jgi:TPR repeat protein
VAAAVAALRQRQVVGLVEVEVRLLAAADADEFTHPCPICLDNEDDATVDGQYCGQCFACGQMYCGGCNTVDFAVRSPNCPTCRAPFAVSHEENFERLWKLVHDRSPRRHTPAAQNALGYMYDNGQGVKQDSKEAVTWYRKAAEQGFEVAQHNLGVMYANGQGVKQDHKEAVEWYRKAAAQGNAKAHHNLGCMYRDGQGVKQDHKEAVEWYRKTAEQGNAKAQFNLGVMSANGQGVKQDYKEAVKWYRKAAAQGYADAQYNLGAMCENGQGVLQNFAEALQWWQLAAEQGDDDALKALDMMQQRNDIPPPPPGTAVTAILLTSSKAAKLNNKTGTVVEAPSADMVRPGLAFVRLDGEVKPTMLKLMNLRV